MVGEKQMEAEGRMKRYATPKGEQQGKVRGIRSQNLSNPVEKDRINGEHFGWRSRLAFMGPGELGKCSKAVLYA